MRLSEERGELEKHVKGNLEVVAMQRKGKGRNEDLE